MGDVINKVSGGGYDHNFCVNTGVKSDLVFVARYKFICTLDRDKKKPCIYIIYRACHVPSGRSLEVYSNQLGVQFYTANFLPTASKNVSSYFFFHV